MSDKVREARLHRLAERQGVYLVKSRRRDPHAPDYGKFCLQDSRGKTPTLAYGYDDRGHPSATLDEVEAYLPGEGRRL